jgi:hypothetical protein
MSAVAAVPHKRKKKGIFSQRTRKEPVLFDGSIRSYQDLSRYFQGDTRIVVKFGSKRLWIVYPPGLGSSLSVAVLDPTDGRYRFLQMRSREIMEIFNNMKGKGTGKKTPWECLIEHVCEVAKSKHSVSFYNQAQVLNQIGW